MRILVDQSGYDLLNIGDVSMLQSCVSRLRNLWPDAEIMVICHAPERLASYCPDTTAIKPTFAQLPIFRLLPRKSRLIFEQAWKMTAPYFSTFPLPRRSGSRPPRTAIQAVHAADLVVASGGGYVTDTWWWHAVGVLSLMSLAQRLGKPTAMFGQGIGPVEHRVLRAQARSVLPRLTMLGLREDQIGRDLALSLGVLPGTIAMTGDDALEIVPETGTPDGRAVGLSMRVSDYAGVDHTVATIVIDLVLQAAGNFGVSVVALPVSRYAVDGDLDAIRASLKSASLATELTMRDLTTPEALAAASGKCRVIITGSYHAAVFGLAQGVPTVCLTKSAYYDAKFAGLRAQFPSMCFVVALDQPDLSSVLSVTMDQAWRVPAATRARAKAEAVTLCGAGRDAYRKLRDLVEKNVVMATTNRRDSSYDHAN